MKHGKFICDTLKKVRLDIARANGIKYDPTECHHEGDCAGTCPACESEMRYLEREIARRRSHGKVALITGVSLGVMSLVATSCHSPRKVIDIHDPDVAGDVVAPEQIDPPVPERREPERRELFGKPAEPMPVFPGGEAALEEYIQQHIQYPPEAVKEGIEGTVLVQLEVDAEGKVVNASVIDMIHEYLDEEAIRVCKSLPDFKPGKLGGRTVSSWYVVPVKFQLQGEEQ